MTEIFPTRTALAESNRLPLTLKEAVERIRAGKPVIWLTMTDDTDTYEVAIDGGVQADWPKQER